ncbi:MAG: serine protease [Rickettsiales bacterium]|nr:serine protease [Rickettsiales bacterium]
MTYAIASPSFAQVTHYSTGTGFFVSRNGHVVTNAHVVPGCLEIQLRTQDGLVQAELVSMEEEKDLALLRSNYRPAFVGKLRWMPDQLQPGDRVQMLGFPEEYGMRGEAHISEATIISLYGPQEEQEWLSFSDSARHGNSGGPLMDQAGNVVGVVTAKALLTRIDPSIAGGSSSQTTDVAVTVPILKEFLDRHRVLYLEGDSQYLQSDQRIRNVAERYTVQVLCRLD